MIDHNDNVIDVGSYVVAHHCRACIGVLGRVVAVDCGPDGLWPRIRVRFYRPSFKMLHDPPIHKQQPNEEWLYALGYLTVVQLDSPEVDFEDWVCAMHEDGVLSRRGTWT